MATKTIQDRQNSFWDELKQSNPTMYVLAPTWAQHYYISKKKTQKPYQLRLDVYFDVSDYDSRGRQSFTICNVPKGGLKDIIVDGIKNEFGSDVRIDYYDEHGVYLNCCVIKRINPNLSSEKELIQWFNDHITNLISLLRL